MWWYFFAVIVEIKNIEKWVHICQSSIVSILLEEPTGKIVKFFAISHLFLDLLENHGFKSAVERYQMQFGIKLIFFRDCAVELEKEQHIMLIILGLERGWTANQTTMLIALSTTWHNFLVQCSIMTILPWLFSPVSRLNL